jgi:hypothetical protein
VSADHNDDYRAIGPIFVSTEQTRAVFKLGGTPRTLLVSSRGILLANWLGAYVSAQSEIEHQLGVKLPGLLPEEIGFGR